VIIELQSATLGEESFVVDYRKLSLIKDFIDEHLDHRHLNDVMMEPTTAENIAKYIFELFNKTYPQLSAVTVKEDNTRSARYTPEFGIKKQAKQDVAEKINDNML